MGSVLSAINDAVGLEEDAIHEYLETSYSYRDEGNETGDVDENETSDEGGDSEEENSCDKCEVDPCGKTQEHHSGDEPTDNGEEINKLRLAKVCGEEDHTD